RPTTPGPAAASGTLLQRQCACGNRSTGGECDTCKRQRIQRKPLFIGAVDDPLEAKADRAADAVMSDATTPSSSVRAAPLQLSRAPSTSAASAAGVPPSVEQVLGSPGRALDAVARAFMEPRFGRDFSHVRVHDDPQAHDSARAVDAAAYTVGPHVVF